MMNDICRNEIGIVIMILIVTMIDIVMMAAIVLMADIFTMILPLLILS